MKKIFIIIALFFLWSSAIAQYPYIRIANVTVTPDNQDCITSDHITGMVRYDSASRTLILQNATIYRYDSGDPNDESNGHTLVVEAHSGQTVNIELTGNNIILGSVPMVLGSGSYNITGTGSLNLNGIVEGVLCELGVDTFRIKQGASVVIDVPYMPSTGFMGSQQYQDYDQTVLSIDSGTLIIDADYCIRSIVGFQLNGSYIASPGNAYYDPGSKTLVTGSGIVRDHLEIRPGTVGIDEHCDVPFRAWGVFGGIRIENIPENSPVEVINILGQVVCRTTLNRKEAFIPALQGIYVVRLNHSTIKVVVK